MTDRPWTEMTAAEQAAAAVTLAVALATPLPVDTSATLRDFRNAATPTC